LLYNCHTHTFRSHDSDAKPEDIISCAINAGLDGIIFTDHCDCEYSDSIDYFRQFELCESDYLEVKNKYGDKIELMLGIELGDPVYAPEFAKKITNAYSFDAVLLSIHAVRVKGFDMPFSTIDFSKQSDDFIEMYLSKYFEDMLESVKSFDFDILSHLTVPLRYIRLVYGRKTDIKRYYPVITEILKELINKDKALEINTASTEKDRPVFFPDSDIVDMYLLMGGRFFTLGSDSHTPQGVSKGLISASELLKNKGVNELCFYKNRKRLNYNI